MKSVLHDRPAVRGPRVEDRTRGRVARVVLETGPTTAVAVAERLGLTPAGVRRHLDALLADGLIEERSPRPGARGRGRPARLFAMTDAGRDQFDTAYDDLAVHALRFVAETSGREAVAAFARARVAELEARYRGLVADLPPEERTDALARALSGDGYAASASPAAGPAGTGAQLCQHHCPVAHVAGEFPELCEAETEVFGRLLGTHVQRLATIAHGDGVCTTYVPRTASTTTDDPTSTTASGGSL